MAAFQAMGTSPERRDRLKRLEIGLAMIGAATIKKKGSKPSDPFSGAPLAVTSLNFVAGQGKTRKKHRS